VTQVFRFLAAVALVIGVFNADARPISSPVPVPAAVPPPAIGAPAYLLVDLASGQGIVAEAADERREPASLTKLMTAYLAFAALHSMGRLGQTVNAWAINHQTGLALKDLGYSAPQPSGAKDRTEHIATRFAAKVYSRGGKGYYELNVVDV